MPATKKSADIPSSLRIWFIIHFVIDILFAIPLLLVPAFSLRVLGWHTIDPTTTRLVGAALVAIGLESFLMRNGGREAFRNMLNLKLIWSSGAVLGIGLSIYEGAPPMAWAFLAIFVIFFGVWFYFRRKLLA